MKLWLHIAARNLWRNKRRTLLAVGALALGVGIMIDVLAFLNTMKGVQTVQVVYGQLVALQVHRKGYVANILSNPLELDFEDTSELRQKVQSIKGVKAMTPRILFNGMISVPPDLANDPNAEEQTSFLNITAIDPLAEKNVCPTIYDWIIEGRMLANDQARELIINAEVGKSIKTHVVPEGDPVPDESQWPVIITSDRDGAMNGEALLPVGHLGSALPGDRRIAYVPIQVVQRLLRMEGRVTEYAISLNSLDDLEQVQQELQKTLGPDFEVHRWDELLPFIKNIQKTATYFFNIVTSIFMVIVLLGILNTMLMNVMERIREIGTMMAVGVRRSKLVLLFVMEGITMGTVGGLCGIALGLVGMLLINAAHFHIPAPASNVWFLIQLGVSGQQILQSMLLTVVGSAVASLWPAIHASKLLPVEALRG